MKKIIKIATVFVLAITINSCSEDADNTVNQVFDNVQAGAVLRTVQVIENEYPLPSTSTAKLALLLEEQDAQDGALLEKVEVTNRFLDASTGIETSDVLVQTIMADEFSTDTPFGLPRYNFEFTQQQAMTTHGLTDDDIFGGDYFTTELILYLTDGRIYNSDNAGGIITGGFFASPFQYRTSVICAIPETAYVGDYTLTQISSGVFGEVWADGATVTLSAGENSVQRVFPGIYLPQFGFTTAIDFGFEFICGNIIPLGGQQQGLACTAGVGISLGPPVDLDYSTYDFLNPDDSVFEITFREDESASCGSTDVIYRLTKQ